MLFTGVTYIKFVFMNYLALTNNLVTLLKLPIAATEHKATSIILVTDIVSVSLIVSYVYEDEECPHKICMKK